MGQEAAERGTSAGEGLGGLRVLGPGPVPSLLHSLTPAVHPTEAQGPPLGLGLHRGCSARPGSCPRLLPYSQGVPLFLTRTFVHTCPLSHPHPPKPSPDPSSATS